MTSQTVELEVIAYTDLVPPLFERAAEIYRDWQTWVDDANLRRVDPNKSPTVQRAAARFDGACMLLVVVLRALGMPEDRMDSAAAYRAVVQYARTH